MAVSNSQLLTELAKEAGKGMAVDYGTEALGSALELGDGLTAGLGSAAKLAMGKADAGSIAKTGVMNIAPALAGAASYAGPMSLGLAGLMLGANYLRAKQKQAIRRGLIPTLDYAGMAKALPNGAYLPEEDLAALTKYALENRILETPGMLQIKGPNKNQVMGAMPAYIRNPLTRTRDTGFGLRDQQRQIRRQIANGQLAEQADLTSLLAETANLNRHGAYLRGIDHKTWDFLNQVREASTKGAGIKSAIEAGSYQKQGKLGQDYLDGLEQFTQPGVHSAAMTRMGNKEMNAEIPINVNDQFAQQLQQFLDKGHGISIQPAQPPQSPQLPSPDEVMSAVNGEQPSNATSLQPFDMQEMVVSPMPKPITGMESIDPGFHFNGTFEEWKQQNADKIASLPPEKLEWFQPSVPLQEATHRPLSPEHLGSILGKL